ncbi:unnamed protein product, partial [marine sediment metagenome]
EIEPVLLAISPSNTSNAPAQNNIKGIIQANANGKCNPPIESKKATLIEQAKPMYDMMFGVIPHLIKRVTGRSTNLLKILL